MLSQWRGYGDYAIRFKQVELFKLINNPSEKDVYRMLGNVEYVCDENEFEEKFSEQIRYLSGILHLKENHPNAKNEDNYWDKFYESFLMCCFLAKHIGFKEEKEVRVVTARWQDFEGEIWAKPAFLTKQNKISRIPLSQEAIDILQKMKTKIVPEKKLATFTDNRIYQNINLLIAITKYF